MYDVVKAMNGPTGRAARVGLGLVLVYLGLAVLGGTAGAVLAVGGLLPILLGLWGRCLLELFASRAATKRA